MRKVVLGLALSVAFGVAHAETNDKGLFDCMDDKTFELNSQCMSDQIGNSMKFREAQNQVINVASQNTGEYVVATMTFDQRKMQIDIVAHREALLAKNALAAVNNK